MSKWEVGDLALCVEGGPIITDNRLKDYPEKNKVYRVVGLRPNTLFVTGESGLSLIIENGPPNLSGVPMWSAERFRKIKPDTEAANEDDAAWLKALLTKEKVNG